MNYNRTGKNDNIDGSSRVLCQLAELGMSCFGCCGANFTDDEGVMNAIKTNGIQFRLLVKKYKGNLEKVYSVLNERHDDLRACGVCQCLINMKEYPNIDKFSKFFPKDLVEKNLLFGCPMHPVLNKGKELRTCEINYECRSYYYFKQWDKKKQDEFIQFLKDRIEKDKLTPFMFSMEMNSGKFLYDFLNQK